MKSNKNISNEAIASARANRENHFAMQKKFVPEGMNLFKFSRDVDPKNEDDAIGCYFSYVLSGNHVLTLMNLKGEFPDIGVKTSDKGCGIQLFEDSWDMVRDKITRRFGLPEDFDIIECLGIISSIPAIKVWIHRKVNGKYTNLQLFWSEEDYTNCLLRELGEDIHSGVDKSNAIEKRLEIKARDEVFFD